MTETRPRRGVARPLLVAEGLAKTIGGRTLFEDVTFQLEPGERAALVGPNGAGKSTLLKLLTMQERPDTGQVRLLPRLDVSVFEQHPRIAPDATLAQVLSEASALPAELAEELAALEARMADPALYESSESNAVMSRYGELQREAQRLRAVAAANAGDSALVEELGFTPEDLSRKVAGLSGGERTRLLLARVLGSADPDGLLILDEPTNHLDVETIEWLEERLAQHRGAILVVAHDRLFLDNVATRVLSLERGTLVAYQGNYEDFEAQREEDAARLAARREREEKELERQKAVIEQFRHQKRFDGQMASRLLSLAKLRASIDKTPDPLIERVQMQVGFPESFKSSNDVIRIRGLGKKFGDDVLFYGLDLDVRKGDRIAVVGSNGAGKTTLLRILTGREKKDVGNIDIAPGTKGAYYAQGHETLDPEQTLKQELVQARGQVAEEDLRALLGRYGFRREDDLHRKVKTLSGGERSRLQLLKTILAPSNLLILDEPTNHLDLQSRQALAGALNAYKGALLIVSHDRWFLDSVVDKVAVLARREIKLFHGGFSDARVASQMDTFSSEKPSAYVVKKAFKDFDAGAKHTVGTTLHLTEADLAEKRVYRTALSLGWMVPAR